MSEQPDDWYDDLLDRENNPDFERPRGMAGSAKDEALDYAKDKAVDAGKQAVKKLGKEGVKQGAQAGAEGLAEGAAASGAGAAASGAGAGAAASGAGASVAAGTGIAATTGVETAGVGAAVGAAVAVGGAVLSNKKFRKILYFIVPFALIAAVFVFISIIVLAPVVILAAIANSPAAQAVEVVYDVRSNPLNAVTMGPKLVGIGADAGKDLADAGAGWVEDNSPIDVPFLGAATDIPHDPNSPQVLAAQTISKDSRIYELSMAMEEEGYFKDLKEKYGINVVSTGRYQFDIFLKGKKIHHSNSVADAVQFFASDQRIKERMLYVVDEEHIYKYGKRVTFAENGMSDYKSARLFIPEADKAKEDQEVAKVKKSAVDTVNTPFFTQAETELQCKNDRCGDWVPTTVKGDQTTVTEEISVQTAFQPKNTLRSIMNKRVTENENPTDSQIVEWIDYVRELRRASRLTDEEAKTDEFVQGILNTRKQQAGRLWFNWQTQVDQLKAGKLTTSSGNALFKSLANIGDSKAFHRLNGQKGGKGFKEYEKINENQPNPAATIYEKWLNQNGDYAAYIDSMAGFPTIFGIGDRINDILLEAFQDNAGIRKALESAFKLGSEAMIPKCDSSEAGARYFSCIYAGAQTSYRDINIKKLGANGKISDQDYQEVLAYAGEVDRKIAAQQPLGDRLFSIEGRSSFARTALMHSAVPLKTSGSFVDFQSSLTDTITKLPSILGASLSPNASAAIDEERALNNIDPAGIRISTLLNTPLSPTLNQSTGSADTCPVVDDRDESICRADETVLLAWQGRFGLLPEDDEPTTNTGSEFIIGTYNQKASWSDVHDEGVDFVVNRAKMDVVGTQETAREKYGNYKRLFKEKNYGVYPDWRGSSYPRQCSSGRAIFYNNDKFTFERGEVVSFPSYSDSATNCEDGESTEQGMHNAPIVFLADKQTNQPIIVMNTHNLAFCCGGGGPIRSGERRWKAAQVYVAKIQQLKEANPGVPIFFTGDFNEFHGVQRDRNATHQFKHENLLFCMLKKDNLMVTIFEPDNPCRSDNESTAGGVDSIYTTPEVQVEWKEELAAGRHSGSFSDHPVKWAKVIVPSAETDALRIATFNILHVGEDPFERQWRTRLPKSINVLKSKEVAVAGLQEVRPQQHEYLKTKSYVTDTYAVWPTVSDGPGFTPNPVIYNKDKYSVEMGRTLPIEYDSGKMTDHAVLVKLKDGAGNMFYVLNTHDPANARPGSNNQNALSRLKNARFYRAKLAELARENIPVFLTGDFNSRYTMNGNQQPYNNQAENLTYCVISSGNVMKNVWDIHERKDFRCPRGSDPPGPIDHIYTANTDGVSNMWTVPDHVNGSDHPTVIAEVVMPWSTDNNESGSWRLPVARSGWQSDGPRWLEGHWPGSSAFTNGINAATDINIGSGDADCGKPVYSMLGGTIVPSPPGYTMQVRSKIGGKSVIITYAHGDGMKRQGTVRAGEQIMVIGDNGNPAYGNMTCHLHLEITYQERPVCPQDVLPLVARNKNVNLGSLVTRARADCR